MLSTAHSFLSSPSLLDVLEGHWLRADPCATWEWKGLRFALPRSPDMIVDATRHPDLQRTKHLSDLIGPGILSSTGPAWREGRRIIRDIVGVQKLAIFHQSIVAAIEECFVDLDEAAATGRPVDIYQQMTRAATTAFTRFALGKALDAEGFQTLFRELQSLMVLSRNMNLLPGTSATEVLELRRQAPRAAQTLDLVLAPLISKARAGKGDAAGHLEFLFDAEREGKLQHSTLHSQISNLFYASFLTTGTMLTLSVSEAARSANCWEQLSEEANSPPPTDAPNSVQNLQLPFATSVVDETLRLYPPIWITPRRATRQLSIGEQSITEGTTVYLFTLGAGRDERSWRDPLRWDPARFQPGAQAPIEGSYEPFLSGRHMCLGQDFARTEGALVLSELARRYHITPLDDSPIELCPYVILFPAKPLQVRIHRR